MKRIGLLIVTGLLLTACGDAMVDEETAVEVIEETEGEHTQAQVNVALKEQAVELEHDQAAAGEVSGGAQVFSTGVTFAVSDESAGAGEEFELIAEDGEYLVRNYSMREVEEGHTVKVYGTFDGMDEASGLPVIRAALVE